MGHGKGYYGALCVGMCVRDRLRAPSALLAVVGSGDAPWLTCYFLDTAHVVRYGAQTRSWRRAARRL